MIYVVDSHAIIWHLERHPNLSAKVDEVLSSSDSRIVVPALVLAEVWDLYQRKRVPTPLQVIRSRILAGTNFTVYPLNEAVLEALPSGLDIHDSIIVATALVYRDVLKESTCLITRDRKITDSGLIEVFW